MTRSAGTSGLTRRRVAAEVGHRVAHDREVDDRRHAGEVLEEDPRGHERDLGLGRRRPAATRPGSRRRRAGRSPPPAWRSTFSSRILTVTGAVAEVDPVAERASADRGRGGPGRGGPGRRTDRDRGNASVLAVARYTRWVEAYRATGRDPRLAPDGAMRAWGDRAGDDPERERTETEAARSRRPASTSIRPPPGTPPPRRRDASERPRPPARPLGAGRAAGHRHRRGRRGRDGARRRAEPRPAGRSTRSPAATRPARAVPLARRRAPAPSPSPKPILDEVELIILAVPDDADRAARRLAPDVQRPGDGPHERRARRGGPRAGDGGRDPDRRVPPARRVRRHGAGGRRAPRRDGRHRGRRPAGGAAGRHGRGDRRDRRSASPRARRRPTTRRPSSRPAASSRCSTRSPSSAGSPVSTRRARWRSTARSSRRRSATPGPSGSGPP